MESSSQSGQPRSVDLASLSDADLILQLKAGQSAALSILYDRYSRLVFSLALNMLTKRDEAEDLVQDIFLTLWRQGNFDPKRGSLSSYLCILTRSRSVDRLRSRSSNLRFLERWQKTLASDFEADPLVPFEQVSMNERCEYVQQALTQISPDQRQILELLYYQGMSQSEISKQLNIPLGTVKTRSRQGLLKLRQSLQPLIRS